LGFNGDSSPLRGDGQRIFKRINGCRAPRLHPFIRFAEGDPLATFLASRRQP
jgi:hypothetical protein